MLEFNTNQDFKFEIPSSWPTSLNPYRVPPHEANTIEEFLKNMEKNRISFNNDFTQQAEELNKQLRDYSRVVETETPGEYKIVTNPYYDPLKNTSKVIPKTTTEDFDPNGLNAINGISNSISSALPNQREYNGPKGHISQGLDRGFDVVREGLNQFGPVGKAVSTIWGVSNTANKAMNALGYSTDGMTNTDQFFSSNSPLAFMGWINSAFGQNTDDFSKNNWAFEKVGSSYTGLNNVVDDALELENKKYGWFSNRARRKANGQIQNAREMQSEMNDIAEDANDLFAQRNSMSALNGIGYNFALNGGYQQNYNRIAKNGCKLDLNKAKQIISKQKGGVVQKNTEPVKQDPFDIYLESLPLNQRNFNDYRVREYWEYNDKPQNFLEAIQKGMFSWNNEDNSWHARSVAQNPVTGEIEFMKYSSHPHNKKEIEWYYSPAGESFRNEWDLVKSEPYHKYVRKPVILKRQESIEDIVVPSNQKGGSIIEIQKPSSFIQLINPDELEKDCEEIPSNQKGGSINIIPDGALHAHKHDMDIEGITKKGIPVISESEGGEIEQHAEVEKEEIIFRLEVTEKLEKLNKIYNSEESTSFEKNKAAVEAGKLLVEEILHNTQDNTNKLL